MTKQAMLDFEQKLLSRGYKKWTQALYSTEDYDVSRLIRDEEGEDKYQIIFRFWDWAKYRCSFPAVEVAEKYECSVDLVIMPCGLDCRADIILSSFDREIITDVERVEKMAEEYYQFIKEQVK